MTPVATDDRALRAAVRALVAEFHPEKIYLFGSRVWGKPTEDSDYDFLVIVPASGETPVRRAQRGHRALRGLGVPTDVLVKTRAEFNKYAGVYASLECQVLEEGHLLYG